MQEKVRAVFYRFKARCFWNVSLEQPLAALAPMVVRRLRKYGGMDGLRVAAELEQFLHRGPPMMTRSGPHLILPLCAGGRIPASWRDTRGRAFACGGASAFEGIITDERGESSRLQWAADSAVRFFPVIEDPVFGYRLHDLDLAVNKVLAMAGRREPRDYYDVVRLHRDGVPLAALAWAAPAKDPGFTPDLILDEINRNSNYPVDLLRAEIIAPTPPDPRAMKQVLLTATREARDLFPTLPLDQVGHLYLDREGQAVMPDPTGVREGRLMLHGAVIRGAWPMMERPRSH